MKISSVDTYSMNIALTESLRTPLGVMDAINNVVIKITTNEGLIGWGEASPFAPITGDSQQTNLQTAQQLAQVITGKDPLAIEARMTEVNRFTIGEPSIRSAFDMALYDIAAKAADMPLYQFWT